MWQVDAENLLVQGFNPRPAVRPGDVPGTRELRLSEMFQSAPGREAGRCGAVLSALSAGCRFNPRPAVRPGDAACVPSCTPLA